MTWEPTDEEVRAFADTVRRYALDLARGENDE
jgi:hypothetical protein